MSAAKTTMETAKPINSESTTFLVIIVGLLSKRILQRKLDQPRITDSPRDDAEASRISLIGLIVRQNSRRRKMRCVEGIEEFRAELYVMPFFDSSYFR